MIREDSNITYFSFINYMPMYLQAAVTDIQVLPNGFVSCGGDGSVKLVQIKDLAAAYQR
jgi:hypothetical protein